MIGLDDVLHVTISQVTMHLPPDGSAPSSAVPTVMVPPYPSYYPDRETWLTQLAYLQEKGVKFDRRVEHGMTHSLYIHDPNGYGVELLYELPRDVWEGDIDGALNYAEQLPTEGTAALEDRTDGVPVFKQPVTA